MKLLGKARIVRNYNASEKHDRKTITVIIPIVDIANLSYPLSGLIIIETKGSI